MNRKFIGVFLILASLIASAFYIKVTGAFIGYIFKFNFIIVIICVLFLGGIFLISGLEKKILNGVRALVVAGAIAYGANAYSENNGGKSEAKKSEKEEAIILKKKEERDLKERFKRTYRWDKVLDKVEKTYAIPKGLLKGLAMQESNGDPLRLNHGGDGGAGLFMFQPGTAREEGLKIYGDSKGTGRDSLHGAELKELVNKYHNNYNILSKIDERFDVKKASNAAADLLRKKYEKYKSWGNALSAYNHGKPAKNPLMTEHVRKVREYQKYYNQRDKN